MQHSDDVVMVVRRSDVAMVLALAREAVEQGKVDPAGGAEFEAEAAIGGVSMALDRAEPAEAA